ncbi:nucleoside triphosphatase NudI, partial [Citrobacter portucalensis]|uniref:nucleoside triphosphatase NudI n=1 Tax=Citrobacter portucalensis TaxID=1639133 RepID=UPI002B24807B
SKPTCRQNRCCKNGSDHRFRFPSGPQALRREVREELGEQLVLSEITPWTFSDDIRTKTYADGSQEEIYMIYLIFDCVAANREVKINEEFQAFAWVKPEDLGAYDLNIATRKTLTLKGLL